MNYKKNLKAMKYLSLGVSFAIALGLAINYNLEKTYQPGEYIKEENAYYGGPITDPTGHNKAQKFTKPSDNKYNTQKSTHLGTSLVGDIESVWSSYTGKGTTIAIIDDGFDVDHPEFTRADGTSVILSTSRYYYESGSSYKYKEYSKDPDCIKEDWEEVDEDDEGNKVYGWATHGTATSTTAAAPMGNGGGVGIAPEADILAIKIDFSFASIDAAIRYAISQGVDVINMSLGAYSETFTDGWGDTQSGSSGNASYLESACQAAYNAGIIVVAAAGNESTWHKSYPACNYKVIGAGATGDWDNKGNSDKLAEFTNYVKSNQTGEINVDILAPGYVYTAEQTVSSSSHTSSSSTPSSHSHTWANTQGTSFSSPIIAGAACLWKQKYPNGTPDQFLTQLQSSADGKGEYASKMIEVSGWYSYLEDVGPSNIQNGRLNVANLMAVDEPFVSTVQSNLSIAVGEKRQIDLDTYNGTITYSSSNTSVATVSNSGLVEGKGAGNATITVTATKNNHTATATVGVHVDSAVAANSIEFNPKSVTLSVGETYNAEETITVSPSNASRVFLFESNNESVATVDVDTGLVTAVGAGTATINAVAVYGDGDDSLTVTVENAQTYNGMVSFNNTQEAGTIAVSSSSVSGSDSLNNTWTVTTLGTSSFTANASYYQIGSSSKPASSIQFEMELSSSVTFSNVSATFGGFSGTTADVTIKVGTTTIGTGTVPASDDVTVNSTTSGTGTTLTVLLNNIQKGIKAYSISYTYTGGGSVTPTPTVSGVTVTPSSLQLDLNGTTSGSLSASVSGTNEPSQSVTWTSSNASVATVSDSGVVTAKAKGTATITATSVTDTSKSGTCTVTVIDTTPKTLTSIEVAGQTSSLEVGSEFVFGGVVYANFSDESFADVTSQASFSGYNMNEAGVYTVTVSYTYQGTTKTTSYTLSVYTSGGTTISDSVTYGVSSKSSASVTSGTAPTGSSIGFSNNGSNGNDQMTSGKKETWTLNGYEDYTLTSLTARLRKNSGGGSGTVSLKNNDVSETVSKATYSASDLTSSYQSYEILSSNIYVEGTVVLTLTSTANSFWCDSITVSYEKVDTSDKIIMSISASYTGGNVYVNGSLDESKVSVTANYTDSSKYESETLSSSDYSLSGFSSTTAGEKTVTVTYTGSLPTLSGTATDTFTVNVIVDSVSNVSITCSKTYHPGETISKNDLTVIVEHISGASGTTTNFTFADDGYRFTYNDAPSGGGIGTKELSIIYDNETYTFEVNVSRVAYVVPTGSSSDWSHNFDGGSNCWTNGVIGDKTLSGKVWNASGTAPSGVYTGNNGGADYNNQFGSGSKPFTQLVLSSSAFSGNITSISIKTWGGSGTSATLSVSVGGTAFKRGNYTSVTISGTNTAYTFTGSASGTIVLTWDQSVTKNIYVQQISVTTSATAADNPTNVANYIMYEDTNNQCTSKLSEVITKLNTMSASDKTTFMTSTDYVIATARERLEAWARNQGKTLNLTNNSFVLSSNNTVLTMFKNGSDNTTNILIIVITTISLAAISLYIYKRKH